MQERHLSFYSHLMREHIDLVTYGHWGYPVLLFPTSLGDARQYHDKGLIDSVTERINNGELKIYSVATIDQQSFYSPDLPANAKIFNYSLYQKFLAEELLPFIQKEYNVHRIGIGGASLGAYHAVNFAFKNPNAINFLIAMSGFYSIGNFMNGYYDINVYSNSPSDYLKDSESWIFNHMKIVLGTSDWDICRDENIKLSQLLEEKDIAHIYDEKKWITHDWPLWNIVFPEYLNTFL
jgi:esterase/lipase superfamily enzyme